MAEKIAGKTWNTKIRSGRGIHTKFRQSKRACVSWSVAFSLLWQSLWTVSQFGLRDEPFGRNDKSTSPWGYRAVLAFNMKKKKPPILVMTVGTHMRGEIRGPTTTKRKRVATSYLPINKSVGIEKRSNTVTGHCSKRCKLGNEHAFHSRFFLSSRTRNPSVFIQGVGWQSGTTRRGVCGLIWLETLPDQNVNR